MTVTTIITSDGYYADVSYNIIFIFKNFKYFLNLNC